MAVTSGTITSVNTILPNDMQNPLQAALVLFTITGTYAQADNSIVSAVATAIQDSRRNGKTVTLVDAMLWQPAFDASSATAGLLLGAKTIAISTADITFELTEGATAGSLDVATEYTNSTAIPTLGCPMGFIVSFTEA